MQMSRFWWILTWGFILLTGCQQATTTRFTSPPPPKAGTSASDLFAVVTENYFYKYTGQTQPFSEGSQFTSEMYPIPLSYVVNTPEPAGFTLKASVEEAIRTWATADPRISILSGATGDARVTVQLVDRIQYSTYNNVLGLTKIISGGRDPRFIVYIVTKDPLSGAALPVTEIARTITHELGHAFGLGHSNDERDLMCAHSSPEQGLTPVTFLTFGDAMAMWTTLNNRRINWNPTQAAILPAAAMVTAVPRAAEPGTVVCVYTAP
jgi:hypothetical protein